MKISQIKKSGRKIIKGRVKSSAKFLIIEAAEIILFSVLPFLADYFLSGNKALTLCLLAAFFVFEIIAFSAFKAGSSAWFMFFNQKKRKRKAAFWFKPAKSLKVSGLYISMFFRKLMWSAVFLSPGALLVSAAVITAENGGVEFNLFAVWIAGGAVLLLTGGGFLFFFLQRFFLVPYLRVRNPSMKNKEVFRLSKEYMADSNRKTAVFKISFLPWAAAGAAIIPIFWVWSYYSQSCAVLAKEIFKIKEQSSVKSEAQ